MIVDSKFRFMIYLKKKIETCSVSPCDRPAGTVPESSELITGHCSTVYVDISKYQLCMSIKICEGLSCDFIDVF